MRRSAFLPLVLGLVLGQTGELRAQPSPPLPRRDPAAAEALFTEGRNLLKAGRVAEACTKLEASQKLDPADGTLLNLGDCYEKADRLASAWLTFREAAAAAANAGKTARAAHARDRAMALEPRLCMLRITVDAPTSAPVFRDDVLVDPVTFGEALPVDAGRHSVVVRSDDKVMFRREVELAPANGRCAPETVAIPALPRPAPTSSPDTARPVVVAPKPVEPTTKPSAIPLIVAGTGIVAIGVSTALGFHAKSGWDEAKSKCEPRGCGAEAQALAADAQAEGTVGTAVFIGGAVLVVGGIAWWFLARSPSTAGLTVSPARHHGALVLGRF